MQHEGSLPVFGVILAHVPKRCVHTRACDLVAMVVTVALVPTASRPHVSQDRQSVPVPYWVAPGQVMAYKCRLTGLFSCTRSSAG
jgi:hypothetical protein